MGQYFHPIILDKDKKTPLKFMYSHEYDNGMKLMEHSYMKNNFVQAFETLIAGNPQRVVWAGDYAPGDTRTENIKVMFSKEIGAFLKKNVDSIKSTFVEKVLAIEINYAKDLVLSDADLHTIEVMKTLLTKEVETFISSLNKEEFNGYSFSITPKIEQDGSITVPLEIDLGNTYDKCEDNLKVKPKTKSMTKFRFIVNHSKKLFVDKTKVPIAAEWKTQIHPLPLLTSEGNGNGRGDFHSADPKKIIGTWARDEVSVETKAPEGFTELIFDLIEKD